MHAFSANLHCPLEESPPETMAPSIRLETVASPIGCVTTSLALAFVSSSPFCVHPSFATTTTPNESSMDSMSSSSETLLLAREPGKCVGTLTHYLFASQKRYGPWLWTWKRMVWHSSFSYRKRETILAFSTWSWNNLPAAFLPLCCWFASMDLYEVQS